MTQVTVPIAASADDGYVYGDGATYVSIAYVGAGSTENSVWIQRYLSGTYRVLNALLRFNTSGYVPAGVTITAATLQLMIFVVDNANARNIVADYITSFSYVSADWSITSNDIAIGAVPLSSLSAAAPAGALNSFTLRNLHNITPSSTVSLRLHIDGGQPTGMNNIEFASFDGAVVEPRLVIDYETASRTRGAPDAIAYQNRFSPTLVLSDLQIDPDL